MILNRKIAVDGELTWKKQPVSELKEGFANKLSLLERGYKGLRFVAKVSYFSMTWQVLRFRFRLSEMNSYKSRMASEASI